MLTNNSPKQIVTKQDPCLVKENAKLRKELADAVNEKEATRIQFKKLSLEIKEYKKLYKKITKALAM